MGLGGSDCLSVMLSPRLLDNIQPNSVCKWALGPGEGSKAQISLNINYIVNFKENRTLYVFLKIKDIKHMIKRNALGGTWGQKVVF